jgi:hypothetical protein
MRLAKLYPMIAVRLSCSWAAILSMAAPAWAAPDDAGEAPRPPAATAPAATAPAATAPAATAPAATAPAATAPASAGVPSPAPAPAPAGPSDHDAASASFNRGLELLRKEEHAAALAEFERAYQLSPVYQVLYYIGALNVRLERWARARRAFDLYLKLGGPHLSAQRVDEVHAHLDELSQKTATLTLTLNVPGADVQVDGAPVEATAVSGLILDSGEHVVSVSKPGFKPLEQVLRAIDGENVHLVLPLARSNTDEPTPVPHRLPDETTSNPLTIPPDRVESSTPLWIPWTVTGALAAGWVTTAGLAIQARHDRNAIERPETPDARIEDARKLHMTLAVVSDILLASTLASAGVSAYLTWWPDTNAPASSGSGSVSGADGLSLGFSGRF